jgi:hypothetical protein
MQILWPFKHDDEEGIQDRWGLQGRYAILALRGLSYLTDGGVGISFRERDGITCSVCRSEILKGQGDVRLFVSQS